MNARRSSSNFDPAVKYIYDYETTGREHVEDMKVLALEGKGLATYINRHVRNLFAEKI